MKRTLKIAAIAAGTLFLLIAIGLAFTQTAMFREWLRGKIESTTSKHLNGQLSIGSLEGNLFTHMDLEEILVRDTHDTILYIKSINVDLSPSRLLHYELAIDSVSIIGPYIKLNQAPDSNWNVAHLIKVDSAVRKEEPAKSSRSRLRMAIGDFTLRDGLVRISALDSTMPSEISAIGARFTTAYSDTLTKFDLKEFAFRIDRPDFHLVNLSVSVLRRENKFTFSNLNIQTEKNQIGGGGTYNAADSASSSGNLASKPFDFTEFKSFLPGILLSGTPVFELETDLVDDSLTTKIGIIDMPQRIDLRVDIATFSRLLNTATRNQVRYYLSGKLTEFTLGHWLSDSVLAVSASGAFNLSGQGLTPDSAVINLGVNLSDLKVADRTLGNASISAKYDQGNAVANARADGDFGRVAADLSVIHALDEQQYSATISSDHLDLAPITQNDSLKSDLNFRLRVDGNHFAPRLASGSIKMDMLKSTIYHVPIDTMVLMGSFDSSSYTLDTVQVSSPILLLSASARGKYSGNADGAFTASLRDLGTIGRLLGFDSVSGAGTITGLLGGRLDSLALKTDLGFTKLQYGGLGAAELSGSIVAVRDSTNLSGSADIIARQIMASGTPIDSISTKAKIDRNLSDVDLSIFYRKGIDATVTSRVSLDTPIVVVVPSLVIHLNGDTWTGGSKETRIAKKGDGWEVHNFSLKGPGKAENGAPNIEIDGTFSPTGAEDLNLAITSLDLEAVTKNFNLPAAIGGQLTAETHVTGSASNPIVSANVVVDSGLVNQYRFSAFHTKLKYDNDQLVWSSSVLPYQADSVAMSGTLPIHLSFTGEPMTIHRDQPIELKVHTDGLPLNVIAASGQEVKRADGLITADVTITGTLNSPTAIGKLGIRNGAIALPKMGVDYRDIQAGLSVTNQQIVLDTLQVRRDRGVLTGSGTIQFQDNLMSGSIKTTQFDFMADKFYVARHKDFKIQISGDAHIKGDPANQTFGGSITVLSSMFFLPMVLEQAATQKAAADKSVPLLVAATTPKKNISDTSNLTVNGRREVDTTSIDWYRNLKGELKVAIPKNTWLRSPDMNLEIGEGDIDLVKKGADFEIFGPIKILRGQYNLYGKRFTITQGNLLFTGGAEYNPEITMEAQYTFRTADREKRTLNVDISGKAFKPILKFTIDDNVIEERDVIAYVMYGRSMDELTSGQKSETGSAQENLARGAAANMLAGQLSQTLGSKLGLDVVDISSQGSLSSATLTVGKYLTSDLFMSYSRGVGQSQDAEPVPQIVTLEYELNKFIFLQLLQGDEKSSGADLIFKFQH